MLRGEVGSWIPTFQYSLSVQNSMAEQSTPINLIIKVLAIHKYLTLVKETDRMSRNVCNNLQIDAA
jgi:hypothetical protein